MESGKIKNEALLEAIEVFKAENNQQNLKNFIEKLLQARFILPATLDPKPVKDDQGRIMGDGKFRVNFRVITDNTGKNFFPCFTNDEEFEHAIKEVEVEKMALTYKEVAPLVLNSNGQIQGIVIDPYTVGMQVPDALIKTVDESRKSVLEEHKNTNIKKHTIPANTKIRLRSPKYMPVDMLDEAKKFLAERPNVKAAYIQMMEKENSDEEYLITIDFEGDEEDLFDSLLPKIKPLAFGIPIALTGTDNGLGKKVTEVEMKDDYAPDANEMHKIGLEHEFAKNNVKFHLNTSAKAVTDDGLICTGKDGSEFTVKADTVLIAAGMRADWDTVEALKYSAPWCITVGDCIKAGKVADATQQGYYAALDI